MRFPAYFKPDLETGGYVVTFRDLPEAITQGETEEECIEMAQDVLIEAMISYFDEKKKVPAPSKAKRTERFITLPPSISSKVLLLNEMISQQVSPSELARLMGTNPQEVNRLIDLKHATKIDRIGEALSSLGRTLVLSLV